MSSPLTGSSGAPLALLTILGILEEVRRKYGVSLEEIISETLSPSEVPNLARLSSIVRRGDIGGAVGLLAGDPVFLSKVLEEAERLPEAAKRVLQARADSLRGVAAAASEAGLYYDAAVLMALAVTFKVRSGIGRTVTPLDALLALERTAGQQYSQAGDAARFLFREELCYPRGECPFAPMESVEEAGRAYIALSSLYDSLENNPPNLGLLEGRLLDVERERFHRISRLLLGDLPGVVVVLSDADLPVEPEAGFVLYDNTRIPRIEATGAITVPLFGSAPYSLESVWRAKYGPRIAESIAGVMTQAPLYTLLLGYQKLRSSIIPSEPPCFCTAGSRRGVLVRLKPLFSHDLVLHIPRDIESVRKMVSSSLPRIITGEWMETAGDILLLLYAGCD